VDSPGEDDEEQGARAMAGKKKGKKDKKAAKKARKAAKKAARRAAKLAKKAPRRVAKKAPRRVAKKARKVATKRRKVTKKVTKKVTQRVARRAAVRAHKARQQPESLRLRSAGPSLTVNDIHRSLAFYRDVLGFTPKDKWEEDGSLKGIELVAGSVSFWLGQDDWKKGKERVKGEGFRMYCGTTQDIEALAARVRGAGVALAEEPKQQSWGGRDFAVRDPDGFLISISSDL
jgi:catechol 2,3-dioxygenase-like lactoylglutathione lyase family enzyme